MIVRIDAPPIDAAPAPLSGRSPARDLPVAGDAGRGRLSFPEGVVYRATDAEDAEVFVELSRQPQPVDVQDASDYRRSRRVAGQMTPPPSKHAPFKHGPLPATKLDGQRGGDRHDDSGFAAHARWFQRLLLGLPE